MNLFLSVRLVEGAKVKKTRKGLLGALGLTEQVPGPLLLQWSLRAGASAQARHMEGLLALGPHSEHLRPFAARIPSLERAWGHDVNETAAALRNFLTGELRLPTTARVFIFANLGEEINALLISRYLLPVLDLFDFTHLLDLPSQEYLFLDNGAPIGGFYTTTAAGPFSEAYELAGLHAQLLVHAKESILWAHQMGEAIPKVDEFKYLQELAAQEETRALRTADGAELSPGATLKDFKRILEEPVSPELAQIRETLQEVGLGLKHTALNGPDAAETMATAALKTVNKALKKHLYEYPRVPKDCFKGEEDGVKICDDPTREQLAETPLEFRRPDYTQPLTHDILDKQITSATDNAKTTCESPCQPNPKCTTPTSSEPCRKQARRRTRKKSE